MFTVVAIGYRLYLYSHINLIYNNVEKNAMRKAKTESVLPIPQTHIFC